MKRTALPATVEGSGEFFDERPIELPGFRLRARSVQVLGKPPASAYVNALQFARATEEASPYWIGDILAHLERREDLKDAIDQVVSLTGLARQTVHNRTYISRRVEEPERLLAPSLAHAGAVAALERPQQTKVLEAARKENWTVQQTAKAVRDIRRPLVLEGQAELEGMYRVILATPDWRRMPIHAIAGLPVQAHAAADAVLFLWTPPRLMAANPGVREVLEGWGFTYATNAVWDRVQEGSAGKFLSVTHEHLVIATRGTIEPDTIDFHPRSVHVERRPLEELHVKPTQVRKWIERFFIRGPFLELFGLEAVEGWSVFGRDPSQWALQAQAEVVA